MKISHALLLAAASTCLAGCHRSEPQESKGSPGGNVAVAPKAKPATTIRPDDKPATRATKMSLRAYEKKPAPGKRDIWTLKVTDAKTGAPIEDFDVARGRLMNLTVVKSDLSWLGTINPSYSGRGIFTALATLPAAGRYRVFADYTPKMGGHETAQADFSLPGAAKDAPLVPEKASGGWLRKKIIARPEGEAGKPSDASYAVALSVSPSILRAGSDAKLRFQIRDAAGAPVKDLQIYQGAAGQCVAISAGASKYLQGRIDPKNVGLGPDVAFTARFSRPGIYRVWGQFLRRGQVISAPFTLGVAAAAAR